MGGRRERYTLDVHWIYRGRELRKLGRDSKRDIGREIHRNRYRKKKSKTIAEFQKNTLFH